MADGSTRGGVGSTLIQLACHSGLRIPLTAVAGNAKFVVYQAMYTRRVYNVNPFGRWYFTLAGSLMPPVAAPDLSSRPGPRARFTLVRPGEATVILKCPGRRYHSVERVADSMFFGVSTWTFRFLNFLLAVSWLFPRIVTGSNVSYLMLHKAAVLDNNAACYPAKW